MIKAKSQIPETEVEACDCLNFQKENLLRAVVSAINAFKTFIPVYKLMNEQS